MVEPHQEGLGTTVAKLYNRFWVCVTVVLSIAFAVLFFPVVQREFGLPGSALLTLLGILVIWGVYFVRARIFGKLGW